MSQRPDLGSKDTSSTPATAASTMTQQATTASPPPAPPSTALNFNFSKKGSASTKTAPKISSKLSNSVIPIGDDEESEDDFEFHAITYLEDGAIVGDARKTEDKKPLVIKPPETHGEHWLQRRLQMFRPAIVDAPPDNIDLSAVPDTIGNEPINAGLQLAQPRQVADNPSAEGEMNVDEPQQVKSEDDLARDLLIQRATDPSSAPATTIAPLIIPAGQNPLTEDEIFAHDMAMLADAPTLETYERVPVEAFGMGILLGLGWKQGTDLHGRKMETIKERTKRPDFLGLGAKEAEFLRVDAATGKKISRREGLGALWNPLKKIDKVTGEVVVEDVESGRSTPRDKSPRRDGSRDRRRDDDRDRRKDKYRHDSDLEARRKDRAGYDSDRRRDREYDSDRGHKRRDRGGDYDESRRRRDREYDSDHERKRRRDWEGENGNRNSHSHRSG